MRTAKLRADDKGEKPFGVVADRPLAVYCGRQSESRKIWGDNFKSMPGKKFYLIVKTFFIRHVAVQKQELFALALAQDAYISAVYKNLYAPPVS